MANYKVGDYIRLMRNANDMSQEELAFRAGVATETISRIENGKHKITKNVYQKIMSVFDFFPQQFYGICTDNDVEIIDIKQMEEDAEAKFEYEKAREYLEKLKLKAEDTLVNQQYILRTEAIMNYYTGKTEAEEMLEKLIEAFSLTVADYEKYLLCEETNMKVYPFTEQEALILLNIADSYGTLKEHEQDEHIKRFLLKCLSSGYVDGGCVRNLNLVIKRNLARVLMVQKKYKEALAVLEEVLIDAKIEKNGMVISVVLCDIGWNMGMINKINGRSYSEDSIKKIMRQAYYIAAARNDTYVCDMTNQIFEFFFKEQV